MNKIQPLTPEDQSRIKTELAHSRRLTPLIGREVNLVCDGKHESLLLFNTVHLKEVRGRACVVTLGKPIYKKDETFLIESSQLAASPALGTSISPESALNERESMQNYEVRGKDKAGNTFKFADGLDGEQSALELAEILAHEHKSLEFHIAEIITTERIHSIREIQSSRAKRYFKQMRDDLASATK